MDDETNLFNKVVFLMDQNIRGVQIGIYTVAFTGFAIALRSVRPFSRFKKPSDIPNHFIKSRTKLKGTVDRIEPNGALLMVQHRPLIRFSKSKSESLPVKIAGINVTGHGISWLQSIVVGNEVVFVPVWKHNDWVQCEVTLPQTAADKKIRNLNLGPALVSIDFGTIIPIEPSLSTSPEHLRYYRELMSAEQAAIRKKLGIWYYAKPTKEVSLKLLSKIMSFFHQKTAKTQRVTAA